MFVILRADVLHSALALIVVLLALAGIYAGLGAYFIAAIQVVVYAGAVMVLFLFAIMVLRSRRESPAPPSGEPSPVRLHRVAALVAGGVLLVALAGAALRDGFSAGPLHGNAPTLSAFARTLFRDHLLSFELVGLLLLISLVAVMVLAGKTPPSESS